jgi:hypothetical protein
MHYDIGCHAVGLCASAATEEGRLRARARGAGLRDKGSLLYVISGVSAASASKP